jgi:hypothetical protein
LENLLFSIFSNFFFFFLNFFPTKNYSLFRCSSKQLSLNIIVQRIEKTSLEFRGYIGRNFYSLFHWLEDFFSKKLCAIIWKNKYFKKKMLILTFWSFGGVFILQLEQERQLPGTTWWWAPITRRNWSTSKMADE